MTAGDDDDPIATARAWITSRADFFVAQRPIVVARAPGRLDVMGGIADYSGSLVLEMPLAVATWVAVQGSDTPRLVIESSDAPDGRVTIRFDNLWRTSFPYVMVLHQAPSDAGADAFHFFIAFHPPLRQPHLLKYLAGPEIGGGNFLSDTSPETSAAELRALPAVHHAAAAATR